ncbi:putative coatomer, epsilon subunit, tetratricopeptide-like helical domain superfamily [Helianthus annuus]|uniref:Coatomer, epsilon subunit, tetratricopeptide-like helical domain superfamily n=1 Tax=Helianthus annuus TaxID=4232 RepID=A0A9K3HE81_HELAN|nr:putative coatomer, epsilon subunit, tetratricopeptide-like helical domain superfamily [Helianthus annuus]KAJ0483352.1 putative coatomer, epsilon subunit, tetratricopeptide-like helical domain superfamily [Helianthus annuus]
MAGAPDLLFALRNNFYFGAFQAAINSGDVQNLSEEDAIERNCLIYRSYIALGSYQICECVSGMDARYVDVLPYWPEKWIRSSEYREKAESVWCAMI